MQDWKAGDKVAVRKTGVLCPMHLRGCKGEVVAVRGDKDAYPVEVMLKGFNLPRFFAHAELERA